MNCAICCVVELHVQLVMPNKLPSSVGYLPECCNQSRRFQDFVHTYHVELRMRVCRLVRSQKLGLEMGPGFSTNNRAGGTGSKGGTTPEIEFLRTCWNMQGGIVWRIVWTTA
jgi:hypothetical protein